MTMILLTYCCVVAKMGLQFLVAALNLLHRIIVGTIRRPGKLIIHVIYQAKMPNTRSIKLLKCEELLFSEFSLCVFMETSNLKMSPGGNCDGHFHYFLRFLRLNLD